MDQIHRISQFGTCVGRSPHPLCVMDRHGPFPGRWTATERWHHAEADALWFPGEGDAAPQGLTVVHCRVSGRGRQKDPERRVAAMEAYRPGAGVAVDEWLLETGGGLDFKHQVFLCPMERVEARGIAHLPVAHKDRPTLFGFDRCGHFAGQHGCTVTVVNRESLSL